MISSILSHDTQITLLHVFSVLLLGSLLSVLISATSRSPLAFVLRCIQSRWLFIGLLAGLFLALRLPVLSYLLPLNPDEGQMSGNALRFTTGLNTWNVVDGTSGGPLNSMVLLWPKLFGLDITITTGRITGALLMCASIVVAYLTLQSQRLDFVGRGLAIIAIFLFGPSYHKDHIHYSSEHLPIFLLSLGLFLSWWPLNRPRSRIVAAGAGLCFGMIPFTKLQAVPMACLLAFSTLVMLLKDRRSSWTEKSKATLVYTAMAIVPAIVILLPLWMGGGFDDFWTSYIKWSQLYLKPPLPFSRLLALLGENHRFLPFLGIAVVAVGIGVLFTISFPLLASRLSPERAIILFLYLGIALYSIRVPGREFSHYVLFLIHPTLLLSGLVVAPLAEARSLLSKKWQTHLVTLTITVLTIFAMSRVRAAALEDIRSNPFFSLWPLNRSESFFARVNSPLKWLSPPGAAALVYGWMGHWYSGSGFIPAARESENENQIRPSELLEYFRERLVKDVQHSRPELVIDATGPGMFAFRDRRMFGIEAFPKLDSFVKSAYTAVENSLTPPECRRIFLRNDLVVPRLGDLVEVREIRASETLDFPSARYAPERVNDLRTGDEECNDFWLLPDGKTGWIELLLDGSRAVGRVQVLNTRNGIDGNRATREYAVEFYRDQSRVFSHEGVMPRYPVWEELVLDQPIEADRVRVLVLGFREKGGGLNEVKIYAAR